MASVQATPAPESAKNRLGFLDALRGFGALYILVYHVALIPKPHLDVPAWANRIVLNGGTGVTLFFLLSAFALMLSARGHAAESGSARDFYLRRFFRIAPLFYVWIVVSLVRDRLLGATRPLGIILLNMAFCFSLVPGASQGFVWAGWVLGVEMLFYLVFPVVYRYIDNFWKALGFFFASVAFSSGFSFVLTNFTAMDPAVRDTYFYYSFPKYLPVFPVGMMVFFLYEKFIQNKRVHWGWGVACMACAVFLFWILVEHRLPLKTNYLYPMAFAYGMLVIGLSIAPLKILVNPLSRFLGEISYSIYLNHPTIVWAFIPSYLYLYTLPVPRTLQFGLAFLLTLGAVTVLSVGTFEFIEKPGIRLGRWVVRRMYPARPLKAG